MYKDHDQDGTLVCLVNVHLHVFVNGS